MILKLKRLTSNRLYTEGQLSINCEPQTYTVESSEVMLPAGCYTLALVKKNAHCRELVVKETGWRIGIAHSFIGSRKEKMIAIGTPLIPGAVYKAAPDYERIIKRLEKCQERKESIELIIVDTDCVSNQPIKHWLRTPALVMVMMAVLFLSGCGSLRQMPVQTVREVTHDTLYFNRVQYDSVYIDQWQYRDRSRDTVYLEKSHIEYRYKLLRDTVRLVQIDSIPVIKTVEVVKTERYTPWIYRASLWAVTIIIVCLMLFVLWKLLKAKTSLLSIFK